MKKCYWIRQRLKMFRALMELISDWIYSIPGMFALNVNLRTDCDSQLNFQKNINFNFGFWKCRTIFFSHSKSFADFLARASLTQRNQYIKLILNLKTFLNYIFMSMIKCRSLKFFDVAAMRRKIFHLNFFHHGSF